MPGVSSKLRTLSPPLYHLLRAVRARLVGVLFRLGRWNGAVPHSYKVSVVREHARRLGLRELVETGTYEGDMVSALRRDFVRLRTIELDADLCRRARKRMRRASNVEVVEGDSAVVLPKVLEDLREPAVFWLDAHFSGGVTARAEIDTPVWAELTAVLDHDVLGHVVLVDDAHEFDGSNGYPTVEEVVYLVAERRPDLITSVERGIIRIVPAQ